MQDASASFKVDLSTAVKAAARLASEYEDAEALSEALSDGNIALFVNDIKGIPVPPVSFMLSGFGQPADGAPAMDMKSRLESHGLSISLPGNESADHFPIELE